MIFHGKILSEALIHNSFLGGGEKRVGFVGWIGSDGMGVVGMWIGGEGSFNVNSDRAEKTQTNKNYFKGRSTHDIFPFPFGLVNLQILLKWGGTE